jgi:hypothetical protein
MSRRFEVIKAEGQNELVTQVNTFLEQNPQYEPCCLTQNNNYYTQTFTRKASNDRPSGGAKHRKNKLKKTKKRVKY